MEINYRGTDYNMFSSVLSKTKSCIHEFILDLLNINSGFMFDLNLPVIQRYGY